MAKVKIELEKGETELDAHIALSKALDLHNSGGAHVTESFEDPAMVDTSHRMEDIHKVIYGEMIQEINSELDKEYS